MEPPRQPKLSTAEMLSQLVEQMQERLPQDGLRSFCELKLNNVQYENLAKWVKERLTRGTVISCGWKAGAIIFNLITEAARREAISHRLWPIIATKFSEDTRPFLFPNNHPSHEFKLLIQEAAQRLNLRHVFEQDEAQSWYITTHLQFGFHAHGFRNHLPEWLCGQNPPDSVRRLLSGQLRSESFCDLWQALRYYRRDWITEDLLRSVIQKSPWVLPEWENELVTLSRDKLDLVDNELGDDDSEKPLTPLVETPCLEWTNGSDPVFKCQLADWKSLELMSTHYNLMVGDTSVATLFRQPDGNYRSDVSELMLPAELAQNVLNLVDSEGGAQRTQVVDLWDSASEVNIFELPSGRKISSTDAPMSDQKSYLLMVEPDLQLLPSPHEWIRLGGQSPRLLALLSAPWESSRVQVVTSDGAVHWQALLRGHGVQASELASLQQVRVQLPRARDYVQIGQRIQPVVRGLPAEAALVYARFSGKPLGFDQNTSDLEQVTVTPEDAQAGLMFTLGVRVNSESNGDEVVRLRRSLEAEVTGTTVLDDAGWRPLSEDALLTTRDCREKAFRIYFSDDPTVDKAALMEGPRFLRWVSKRAAPLGHAYGMGAPLVLRSQPYNCPSNLLTICKGVDNSGILESVTIESFHEGKLQLHLSRPLSKTAEHCIVVWSGDDCNSPKIVDSSNISTCDGNQRWSIENIACGITKQLVVAIAYRGHWMGSAASGDITSTLQAFEHFIGDKQSAAAMARWLRLPVLLSDRPHEVPLFSRFAHANPEAVLSAWIGNQGLPGSLKHDQGFEQQQIEMTELRELFLAWIPTSEQVEAIVTALSHNDTDPLGDVICQLLMELPLVTGHIVRHWLINNGPPPGTTLRFYMKVLHAQCAPQKTVGHDLSRQMDEMVVRAAESMRVGPRAYADDFFVKKAVVDPAIRTLQGENLTAVERSNLAVALQVAPFRQYLGLRILSDIEREFQER